ncbi:MULTISPECIES: response regulator [Sphingobium]|uniref:response regulator n=1 Tax=Sphingobium TaxID=165695 RepID=UPI0027A55253|nr:Transcriptional regulatory protein TdiR [Sphingobium sp. AntQ-1]
MQYLLSERNDMTYRNTVSDSGQPKILLAEDDPAVRRSLQLALQARGYDVRAHATGKTLLDDPFCTSAACLVADYRLDELDGFEILSRLRSRDWNGPAILITAYAAPGLQERAASLGFGAVIEKPFREGAVGDTIDRLLHAHRQSGGARHDGQ